MRIITTIILTCLLLPLSLAAQVGVNNPDPEQTLDVAGKVRLGDDANAPSAGTIRYNGIEQDFEGHDGTEWLSFTNKSQLPDGITAVQFSEFGLPTDDQWTFPDQALDQGTGNNIFQVVPADKFFVIDKVVVSPTNSDAGSYYVGFRQSTEGGAGFNPQVFIRTPSTGGTHETTANRTPLLVIRPGNRIQIFNSSQSPGQVRFQIYGFYVNQVSDFYGL